MKRMKRWLAMAMAVLIATSTLAGDYLIATAAELPASEDVVAEATTDVDADVEEDAEDTAKEENPYEVTVYQQPTEAPAEAPEVTEKPVVEATKEPVAEATKVPEAEVTPEATVVPEAEMTATPEVVVEATATPAIEAEATPEAEETATPEAVVEATATPEAEAVEELEFSQSVVNSGMKISLYAKPGVLPNDAQLQVKKVTSSMENKIQEAIDDETVATVEETFSFDINIYSESNGGFVQPEDGTVSVTFELLNVDTDDMAVSVYHVEENGKEVQDVEKVASAGVNADEVAFEAEHFSVYTVVLTNNNKTAEVKISCFEVDGDGNHTSIGTDSRITLSDSEMTVEDIRSSLNISGYDLDGAYINCGKAGQTEISAIRYNRDWVIFTGYVYQLQYKPVNSNSWKDMSVGEVCFHFSNPDTRTVKVAVYVMDNGWAGNQEKEAQIGLRSKDGNGFYPVGVIELPEKFITGNSPYLKDVAKWNELRPYLNSMDTSKAAFSSTGGFKEANGDNNMVAYLDNVDTSVFGNIGSGNTALFNWSGSSYGFDGNIRYHLDLRLEMHTVTFINGNNNISGVQNGKTVFGTRGYFENELIQNPNYSIYDFYVQGVPEGYAIGGYYKDANFTQEYTFNQPISGDVKVYVKLVKETFTVTWKDADVTLDTDTNVAYGTNTLSLAPQVADKADEGYTYTFAGWSVENDGTVDKIPTAVTENVTYYAVFDKEPIVYKITYDLDGGSLEGTTNPEEYTIEDTFTLNNPVKPGYTFLGWTGTELSGETKVVTVAKGSTGDREYVAHWSENKISVSGTKTWVDEDNLYETRPDSITIVLKADGTEVSRKNVSAAEDGTWTYEFTDLPTHKNGVEIKYTIAEENVPGYYKSTVSGYNVTNTYVPTEVIVTIKENSGTEIYDGTVKSVTGYTVTSSDASYTEKDFTFSGNAVVKGTNVGTYDMAISADDFTNINKNYKVKFVIQDGQLTIQKKAVTVTINGNKETKTYTGAEQSVTGYEVSFSDSAYTKDDFKFSGVAEAKRTEVGTTSMGLTTDQFTNTNNNYDVTFVVNDGALTINKKAITVKVTGAVDTKTYNGEEQSVTGYTVSIDEPGYAEASISFSGEAVAKGTGVGEYPMGLSESQFANTNPNYDVTFSVTDGKLTITKKAVTVTIKGNTDNQVYNGEEQSVEGYDVSIDDALYTEDDFTFSGEAVAKGTDAGSYPMGLTEDQFTNNNDNYDVTFSVTDGKLTITKKAVTVTIKGNTDSQVYNGEEHSVEGYEVEISDSLYTEDDFAFSGEAVAKGTNVGSYPMGLTKDQFTNNNDNFTVSFAVTDGNLEITKEKVVVTIIGNKDSKVFNGEAQQVEGYAVEISNDLYKETDFTFSGTAVATGTAVGTYPMGLVESQFTNNNTNFNVEFKVTDGELEITKATVTVTITGNKASKAYNGAEQSVAGYEVEISDSKYTTADFTFSGTAVAKRTEVGTTAMGLNKAQFTNNNANFDVTFNVTDGEIEITPLAVTVTITGNNDSKVYNGTEQQVEGYKVSISDALYTEDDFAFNGEAVAKGTDVDTYAMGLAAEQFINNNDNFEVTFNVTDGALEITPLAVTVDITGNKATEVYNGTEQKVEGYEVAISNALYKKENIAFDGTAVAAGTDVDEYAMGLVAGLFENTNKNFDVTFTVTDGQLTITPLAVTVDITGNNASQVYNGAQQQVEGYEVAISNDLYKEADFTFSGKAVAAGKDVATYPMGLAVNQFKNNNDNFEVTFNVTDGALEITKKTVIMTSDSSEKVYDGKELTSKMVVAEGFVDGEGATYSVTGSQTEVGSSENTFTYTLNENTKADNYDITTVNGTLTVTAVKDAVVVTITGKNDSVVYDGQAHTVTGYTVSDNSDVYTEDDFTFNGTDTVTETDAGTYAMGLAVDQFTNTNTNFTDVTFVVTDGSLTINKREVTLTSADDTKVYDGTALTNADVTVGGDGFADGEGADYNVTGTQTEVGSSANAFTYTLKNGTKAANYEISKTEGTLEVTPVTDKVTVTITENSDSVVYNGSEQKVEGYTVEIDNKLYTEGDFTFNGDATAKGTNVGTYEMGLKAADFTNTSKNFTNVEFVIEDGKLEITPAEVTVTITGNNDTKAYNKAEQKVEGYAVSDNSELYTEADFTFSGEAVAKGTMAGEYPMGLAVSQFKNTNDNFKVTFEVTDGWLMITANELEVVVTITGKKDSVVYDGAEHSVNGYDVEISNPLYTEADFSFNGTAVATGTNVGEYPMGLAASQFTNNNTNFTKVTFKVTDGKLDITPVTDEVVVTITENSGEYAYDGTEKTVEGYVVTSISNPLYKETDFTFSGEATVSGTDAGSYDMALTAENFANTNKNFDNVTFKIVDGKLTIKPIDVVVTITEHSGEYAYDGQAHTVNGYDVEISNPLYTEADFTFSGTDSVSGTNAGSYDMELKAADFKNTNTNFANVTFVIVDGKLTITPIDVTVTITENSDTVDYDGKEHTVTGYEVEISNKLYTENDFTFSGNASVSGTNVGSYAMELKAEDFANTNDNFANVTFVIVDGQLTINPIDVVVTITEHSGEVAYDGQEHSVTGYDVKISNSLYTEADFTFGGTAEVKGTNAGSYDMALSAADFTNTNANFANVTFEIVDGQLVIKPIEVTVTITEHSDEVDYDGEEHTVSGYDVEISNPLYTEADFTVSENAVASVSGTAAGSYDMELTAADFTNTNANFANVKFVIVDGQLTIKPIDVTVTITEHSDEVDYDGQEHTVTGYDVEISTPLYTVNDFTFSGEASVSGTNAGSYDMELAAADFTNNNKNFDDVTFVIVDGQLVINQIDATVTITEHGDEVEYDGEAHTVTGYDVAIDTDLYKETDFTFSGNDSVSGTKAGSYDMELTAEDFANKNENFKTVTFVIEDGQLVITPVAEEVVVTIAENSGTYTYDGTEKTVTGYTVKEISNDLYTAADFTFSGTDSVSGTDAGSYDMELTAEDFANTNKNFANVTFVIEDGQLVIDPIAEVVVKVQGNTGAVTYDGTEKSVEGYKVTSINNELYTEADFKFNGEAVAKGTDVGEYPMGLTTELFANINANFAKVTFEVTDGKLTIAPKDDIIVVITENSDTVTYNGEEQSVTGYEVTSISSELYTADDFIFSGEAVAKGTNVGTYDMELKAEDFENTNENFANVTFQIVDGMLTINPISEEVAVTITESSGTYTYDGTEKTVEGYEVTSISNELYTEEDFTFSGEAVVKGTEAGSYDMELTAENFENINTEVFTNVRFEIVDGQLVIDPYAEEILVQITGKTDSVLYDGQTHAVEGYDITIDDAAVTDVPVLVRLFADTMSADSFLQVEDIQLKEGCTDKVEKTNAGTYAQGLAAESFENTNKNFSNVKFEVTDGSLEITKRQVTLTSDSGSKVYDGTPLTKKKVRVSGDGFAEGEGATYNVTGKRIEVGESRNVFKYTLKENTLADNYEITREFGKLTVTPQAVNPTPNPTTPDDPTPTDPTPAPTATPVITIDDEPVPMADGPVPAADDDGPAVLGARRSNDPGAAVLGARRGTEYAVLGKRRRPETGDSLELILWYIALGMSVGAAIVATTKVRKNKVD